MTELEMTTEAEVEDFTDELSDEALDRAEGAEGATCGSGVRRQINCYRSGLSGREAPAHLLVDVKRRLHGGSSVWIGWSVV